MTVNREDVLSRLSRLAAELAGVDLTEVTQDTHFVNDLNFDSLDVVEYVMTIEDEFEVSIPDEQAEDVKTVAQAADVVMSRLAARSESRP